MNQAVQFFERWADQGLIKRMDFTHLIFVIWTSTQSYAEHHAQLAIIFDKPALDVEDYDRAEGVISAMVLAALGLDSKS